MKIGCASGRLEVSFHHEGYRPRYSCDAGVLLPAAATTISCASSFCAAGSSRPAASVSKEGSSEAVSLDPNFTEASCVWHERITAHTPRSATACA